MTLTARLLLFFLAALGAVLLGFSAALLVVAHDYLGRQADARLEAAAHTLVAACEVDARGVEWEPNERSLAFGVGPAGDAVAWVVTDHRGNVVDQSSLPEADRLLGEPAGWRVRRQRLTAPPAAGSVPPPVPPGETRYPAVEVVVGVPTGPTAAALWRLGAVLLGLSAAVWVAVLLTGRAVCRRALRPLAAMAAAARTMPADDTDGRLPVRPAADELTDLGRAFNGLLDRLGEAHERQRRFTREASHQLRTPLAAVLGQVEVALRRDRPADEYRRVLAAVHGQAERMRKLVEALLLLARSDTDAVPPGSERIDLSAWLPTQLRSWECHPRAGDLRPEVPGPVWAEAHPVLLGEVLNNLLDNALKYSPAGSPVSVRLGYDAAHAWIEVADAGPGIAAADQAHLLRPFFRADDARRQGAAGMGLGLAIASRLTVLMDGSIVVESEPGRGSRFEVRLPAAPSDQTAR